MKKIKLLTNPVRISKFKFDDLEYDAAPLKEDKIARLNMRRWHRLRHKATQV